MQQDDYRVCLAAGIFQRDGPPVCPVDSKGQFTDEVTDFVGQYVKVISFVPNKATVLQTILISEFFDGVFQFVCTV